MDGWSFFSELLYPLNLIDCPNLLCKSVSPSNNFKGCIESAWLSKYSPKPAVSSLVVVDLLAIPVLEVDWYSDEFAELSSLISLKNVEYVLLSPSTLGDMFPLPLL